MAISYMQARGVSIDGQNVTYFNPQSTYQNRGELERFAFLFGERVVRPAIDFFYQSYSVVSRSFTTILPGAQASEAPCSFAANRDLHCLEDPDYPVLEERIFQAGKSKVNQMNQAYLDDDLEKADKYRIEALSLFREVEEWEKVIATESFEAHILSKKARVAPNRKEQMQLLKRSISITRKAIRDQSDTSEDVEKDPEVAHYKKLLGDQLYGLSKKVENDESERLLDEADKCFLKAIEVYKESRDQFKEIISILIAGRGDIENLRGNPERAIDKTKEALQFAVNKSLDVDRDEVAAGLHKKLADQQYNFAKTKDDLTSKKKLFLEAFGNYRTSQQIILEVEGPGSRRFAKTLIFQGDVQFSLGSMENAVKKYAGALFVLESISSDLENDKDIKVIREKFKRHADAFGVFLQELGESSEETALGFAWEWVKELDNKHWKKIVKGAGRCKTTSYFGGSAFGACFSGEVFDFLWEVWVSPYLDYE